MGKIIGNFIGIFIYVILFWAILAVVYGPGSKETIAYSFILGLFFGMLNEIHRDLQKRE